MRMPLSPANPNTFANSPLDRAGHRRRDEAWLSAAIENSRTRIAVFHKSQPFVTEEGGRRTCGWLAPQARSAMPGSVMLFLGVDAAGDPHFAMEAADDAEPPFADIGRFEDLRAAAMTLDASDAAILACAKSIFEWHRRHGYCANCGQASRIAEAGWKRVCDACKAEHFPRVDPVVIMLPVFADRCLLGRQARFPRGMHSALAGFIEPGESIEEAIARETLEEAGLTVERVRYHSTQPWPFPSSLMIGAIADVAGDEHKVDEEELESARWFTREEARLLVEGKHPDAFAPPPLAIAHQLLRTWASSE
jgi:NAD+ diphosphatase